MDASLVNLSAENRTERRKRLRVFFAKCVVILLISTVVVTLAPRKNVATIESKWVSTQSIENDRVFPEKSFWFSIDGQAYRVTYAQWLDVKEGDSVILCTQAGRVIQILHTAHLSDQDC